jgi:chromosome partitioning protein
MQTIVLATQKGGSGKSTLAIGLALAAIQAGHTVRLIETDSQGTLSNWQSRRPYAEPIVEPVYVAGDVEQRLQVLERDGVTLAIVDTSGGLNAATTSAIRHADLCLIPARPSIADIEATASTLSIVRAWNRPFAFILNQTPIRGQRLTHAATTLGDEAALDISDVVAKPFIVMRNDHQDALSAGLAVSEYAPTSKSAEEINALWQWVDAKLNGEFAVRHEVLASNLPEAPLAPLFNEPSAETTAIVS